MTILNHDDFDKLTIEKKKTWVQRLMIGCPAGKPMETCLAKNLRELPNHVRLRGVESLAEHLLDKIIAYPIKCRKKRKTGQHK